MQTESVNNSVVVVPKGNTFFLRFDDDVIHPSYYRFELQALKSATEVDSVEATINTSGGSLATGIEVVNEILNCQAPVTGVLRSSCHSCGSIIFLACHQHEVGLASEMLIHSGSGGAGGTPTQSIQRAHSYKRQVRQLFETVYKGFLEDDELDKMIDEDKEYIFDAEEIQSRLQRMYSYREGVHEEYQQQMEDVLWEENNRLVGEAVEALDGFSEEEKTTFKKIHEKLNEVMEDPESDSVVEDSPAEEKSVTLLDSEGEWWAVVTGQSSIEGGYNDIEIETLTGAWYLINERDLSDLNRDTLLYLGNELFENLSNKISTKALVNKIIKEVDRLLSE